MRPLPPSTYLLVVGASPLRGLELTSPPSLSPSPSRTPAVRRAHLATLNPETGRREPARNLKEYDEWVRRRDAGDASPKDEDDEGDEVDVGSEGGDE